MNYWHLFVSLLLPQLAGFIGAFFTTPSIPGWYATLAKPELAPPNWIFAPVWTTLFICMGISMYLVWQQMSRMHTRVKRALLLFVAHLAVNTGWSLVFFGLHEVGWALAVIAVLWMMILTLIILFYKIDRRASLLLVPYLVWVFFASYLNYMLWVLNK